MRCCHAACGNTLGIRPNQHRFMKGSSYLINLTSFYDKVTCLVDEGNGVIADCVVYKQSHSQLQLQFWRNWLLRAETVNTPLSQPWNSNIYEFKKSDFASVAGSTARHLPLSPLFFSCCVACQLKITTKFPALQASQQSLTAMSPDFNVLHPLFSSPWIVYGELGMVTVLQPGVVSTISPLAYILCGELDIQISVSM